MSLVRTLLYVKLWTNAARHCLPRFLGGANRKRGRILRSSKEKGDWHITQDKCVGAGCLLRAIMYALFDYSPC